MNDWALNVEKVKNNKKYIYETFTAMFMHESYLHIVGNVLFGIFIMYEMEYAWVWSLFLGLIAGVVANCFAIFTYEGMLLGFSGVLASYLGMIISIVLTHCSYLQERFQGAFCMMVVMLVFLSFMVIGLGASLLIHLYGYLLGMLLGAAFLPRHMETGVSPLVDKILKGASVLVCGAIVVVALVV